MERRRRDVASRPPAATVRVQRRERGAPLNAAQQVERRTSGLHPHRHPAAKIARLVERVMKAMADGRQPIARRAASGGRLIAQAAGE
jgi:hypothetical protein